MIIVLSILAVVHVIGTAVWFLAYRYEGAGNALKLMTVYHGRTNEGRYSAYDPDDLPEFWAARALQYERAARLAPVWEGVLVYRATAGIRAARQVRLDRLKTAHKYMEDK